MATVEDHENLTAEIIFAFSDALRTLRTAEYGSAEHGIAMDNAFDVAKRLGWDYTTDENFYIWCLKATHEEICTEGMLKALEVCRGKL